MTAIFDTIGKPPPPMKKQYSIQREELGRRATFEDGVPLGLGPMTCAQKMFVSLVEALRIQKVILRLRTST